QEKKYVRHDPHLHLTPTSHILQIDQPFLCYIPITTTQQTVTFSYTLIPNSPHHNQITPFLTQIKQLFYHLQIINLQHLHKPQPLLIIQHSHQTKIHLFQYLRPSLH
ncbi:hypothetical protein, partial [Staphylococcus epidermidis]|uniref:hypothetical protein n=1 Tax=Staphylococcus epidermidis TaxID=1282 RepID=UPI0028CB3881